MGSEFFGLRGFFGVPKPGGCEIFVGCRSFWGEFIWGHEYLGSGLSVKDFWLEMLVSVLSVQDIWSGILGQGFWVRFFKGGFFGEEFWLLHFGA